MAVFLPDYAMANYAYLSSGDGHGGIWWLRSPRHNAGEYARSVFGDGDVTGLSSDVNTAKFGIVPALTISLQ